jgi:hypothetical protein
MSRRSILGTLALLALILSACSPGTQTPEDIEPTPATALLFPERESIVYPLDKYGVSLDEMNLIERASNIKIQKCLSSNGHPMDLIGLFKDRTMIVERPYGIWNIQSAEIYGYGVPEQDLGIPDLESQTPEFNRQWDICLGEAIPSSEYGSDRASLLGTLSGRARSAAAKDPKSAALIEEWKACLSDAGGTLNGSDPWSPVESLADKETAIRVAVSDISCKESIDFIQRMADIEASYQATLIVEHEAELLAQRQKVDETLKKAIDIVATFAG